MRKKFINEDLRLIDEQLQTCKDSLNIVKDTVMMDLETSYDVTHESASKIIKLTDEQVEKITEENVADYVTYSDTEKSATTADMLEELKKMVESKKETLSSLENQIKEIEEEKNKFEKNYYDYLRSDEYAAKRQERIDGYKTKYEEETDPVKRAGLKKLIDMYEAMDTLSFLFSRIDNDKDNKEIQSVMTAFVSPQKGQYVMNKFIAKCRRIRINPVFYSKCLNLEDDFLPEEYAPFNNFFIFVVMRYIAYIDTNKADQCGFASKIVANLLMLFAHQFRSTEEEEKFKDVIKRYEDYLSDYVDFFKEKNITYKEHPVRIERNKKIEELKAAATDDIPEEYKLTPNVDVNATIKPMEANEDIPQLSEEAIAQADESVEESLGIDEEAPVDEASCEGEESIEE